MIKVSKSLFSEKEYQHFILEKLKGNGYEIWPASNYNSLYAMDKQCLFRFLNETQPDKMKMLYKIHKTETEEVIMAAINTEETKTRGSRLATLKYGVTISNIHLDLMYTQPATTSNKELNVLYGKNIFSVCEEVCAGDKERVDLVIFLNGLAIITFELKANTAGQSYRDAIEQYRTTRDPKTRLFRFKSGALVHFAMDMEEVYMTTKLDKKSTFFLPFNMGCGEGINAGAGNPIFEDKYSVFYMWENILKKDSIIEIISKFMFVEVKEYKDEITGKLKVSENLIFPRYHQLDVMRKLVDDVKINGTFLNYLLQHSPGSGKTNEIAWLALQLSSLHDEFNKIIYDTIVVCTDTVTVDRQLQRAIQSLDHKSGLIKALDDRCNSKDLAKAIEGNTKIIVTTMQKFPYISDAIQKVPGKKFAVIIDEAHSSTAGENMKAITKALGANVSVATTSDTDDAITYELAGLGKQSNVSMFAFTATPKATTLEAFGRANKFGQKEAFHLYSMKQAIEEGFILDVLQNYVTYDTIFKLNKSIESDPTLKTNDAKRQITRFISLHDTNISQKVEIIVEHFRTNVAKELNGTAKAMIVTSSRAEAVKYQQAVIKYLNKKGYTDLGALVAFSGKVELDGVEYTETGMNGISEKQLPAEFDKDEYQVLIVANKYQTGFDQKKLCAMYILKPLHGINAVQTLSRLNRICPPYDKKVFIVDFVNKYEDIVEAFAPYYTSTLLVNSVTPDSVYDLERKIDAFNILNSSDIEKFNDILYKNTSIDVADKRKLENMLQKASRNATNFKTEDETREITITINGFIKFYNFLTQVSCFEDIELHKKYNFLYYLSTYLKGNTLKPHISLANILKATGFIQKKTATHEKSEVYTNPNVKLPNAEQIVLPPQKQEKLSQIIAEINSKIGKNYDNDVAVKAMLQIKDIMMKSAELKISAKNNTEEDFEFAYFDNIDDALIKGLNQNQDFFSLLLQNDEIKKEVLGIFAGEIYKSLKESE